MKLVPELKMGDCIVGRLITDVRLPTANCGLEAYTGTISSFSIPSKRGGQKKGKNLCVTSISVPFRIYAQAISC